MSRNFSTSKKEDIFLKKGLGQNLLTDKNIIKKIIDNVDIDKNDIVLEIGPGLGAITLELSKKAKKVICIEKDKEMIKKLKEKVGDNVEIINADALDFIKNINLKKYKVVANIPYYITSSIIQALLENTNQPSDIYLMVQKEVARRICAKPGDMSVLAVSVQYYANPKILFNVSRNSFYPAPKVDSAFIQIKTKGIEKNEKFFKLVKKGFSHPRKKLANNLEEKEIVESWLEKNKLKAGERAENLSASQWEDLFNLMKKP